MTDTALSILKGIPLDEEEGLGELTLTGWLRAACLKVLSRFVFVPERHTAEIDRHVIREAVCLDGFKLSEAERRHRRRSLPSTIGRWLLAARE